MRGASLVMSLPPTKGVLTLEATLTSRNPAGNDAFNQAHAGSTHAANSARPQFRRCAFHRDALMVGVSDWRAGG